LPLKHDERVVQEEINVREFNDTTLSVEQKLLILEWQNSLIKQPGASATMINAFKMIVKFSNDITKEKGIKVPHRMTWMDGLSHGDPRNKQDLLNFGLKILFVLMCSPHATDKKLKCLDDF